MNDKRYSQLSSRSRAKIMGHTEIVTMLKMLDKGIEPTPQVALELACELGRTEIVRMLLDERVVDHTAVALALACYKGHTEIARMLLDEELYTTEQLNQALIDRIRSGHKEIVKMLLDKGADPTAHEYFALTQAYDYGRTEIVKTLLEYIPDLRKLHDWSPPADPFFPYPPLNAGLKKMIRERARENTEVKLMSAFDKRVYDHSGGEPGSQYGDTTSFLLFPTDVADVVRARTLARQELIARTREQELLKKKDKWLKDSMDDARKEFSKTGCSLMYRSKTKSKSKTKKSTRKSKSYRK